jgi:hypothetical protein
MQLGGKYIDGFGIKNLDLQGELNIARPFTYAHSDSISNYTHYNQPLAHPLGANFVEAIGIVHFQPKPKWTGELKLIYIKQGLDTAGQNLGGNIFSTYNVRSFEYGYKLPSGLISNGVNASLLVSYEVKENLFLDGSLMFRKLKAAGRPALSSSTKMLTLGVRLNMFRRTYDY